ncbi:acetate--CoA ligase [Candidatus Woesearchaeota archaeon]|nr:acetate--CoA ligase [Candidatus Woesearchaeota archaeon]
MEEEIFRKSPPELKKAPNLQDYELMYGNFSQDFMEKELDYWEGKVNAAYNAIDRHAAGWRKNKIALHWAGERETADFTFLDLKEESDRFANLLVKCGVRKGDRVFIFLPRVPELYISFIGILKTGAIAGTMFSAFGPSAIKDRLKDSGAKCLITNSELKKRVDSVMGELPELKTVIVTDSVHSGDGVVSYSEAEKMPASYEIARMEPDDYAFMLYTSGTTGKPKGVMHCHKAVIHEHITAKWVLDIQDDDVYWCTADPGWVTGIAYEILGTWSNGATSVIYEGRFDPEKWYSIIEKYKVNVWYTAPTAIRMLMQAGDAYKKCNIGSLRHLCSVGEPLNPEAIRWGLKAFGLPFHDNWWQTETGGILIANYPVLDIKLGSMGKPFPGVTAAIVDDEGRILPQGAEGNLAIKPGWPSMMKAIWNNLPKYNEYFRNGWYISGDRARVDKDGYFWFIGRADDVIKTAGERVGPFEVESALIEHRAIAEAGVIGKPDALRGEIIKAFVKLRPGFSPSAELESEIKDYIKVKLAGHAYPREIAFVDSLPKTRSGKIMRRVLKARELGLPVGDLSTLEEY